MPGFDGSRPSSGPMIGWKCHRSSIVDDEVLGKYQNLIAVNESIKRRRKK